MEPKKDIPFSAFNIVDLSEAGIKMPLALPNGTKTEHWLRLRGAHSPSFLRASSQADAEQLELTSKKATLDKSEITDAERAITRKMIASLVAEWSSDEECTIENVVKFFEGAPQIQRAVDHFASSERNFVDESFK